MGSGDVAQVLVTGFLKHGHDVMLGTRDRTKLTNWLTQNPILRLAGLFSGTAPSNSLTASNPIHLGDMPTSP